MGDTWQSGSIRQWATHGHRNSSSIPWIRFCKSLELYWRDEHSSLIRRRFKDIPLFIVLMIVAESAVWPCLKVKVFVAVLNCHKVGWKAWSRREGWDTGGFSNGDNGTHFFGNLSSKGTLMQIIVYCAYFLTSCCSKWEMLARLSLLESWQNLADTPSPNSDIGKGRGGLYILFNHLTERSVLTP